MLLQTTSVSMVRRSHFITPVLWLFVGIAGCSSTSQPKTTFSSPTPLYFDSFYSNKNKELHALYHQHQEWRDTPYKEGGLGKTGVDCSGFVHLTYGTKFGLHIPRTTKKLQNVGKKIVKDQLLPGDLVFFKTGFFTRHVGIYFQNNLFLHASTKKGVILSDLQQPYWSKAYWKAVRILPH